jgi:hypothetical protein
MNNIKIIRMRTGEDVIGEITPIDEEGSFSIIDPMQIDMQLDPTSRKQILILSHWLPVQLIKDNAAELHTTDIITAMVPKEEFSEYYQTQIAMIKQEMEDDVKPSKKKKSKASANAAIDLISETMELIEAMRTKEGSKVH